MPRFRDGELRQGRPQREVIRDRGPVDREDDVPRAETGKVRPTRTFDLGDDHALRLRRDLALYFVVIAQLPGREAEPDVLDRGELGGGRGHFRQVQRDHERLPIAEHVEGDLRADRVFAEQSGEDFRVLGSTGRDDLAVELHQKVADLQASLLGVGIGEDLGDADTGLPLHVEGLGDFRGQHLRGDAGPGLRRAGRDGRIHFWSDAHDGKHLRTAARKRHEHRLGLGLVLEQFPRHLP